MSDAKPPLLERLPPALRDWIAKAQVALVPPDGEEADNATLTKMALGVALVGSAAMVAILVFGSGEAPVKAHAIDDPRALRPVDVKWEPGDGREGASTGTGGLGNIGGYGGRLLPQRDKPCTGDDIELPDAVRRTSGIHIIAGDVQRQPCGPAPKK